MKPPKQIDDDDAFDGVEAFIKQHARERRAPRRRPSARTREGRRLPALSALSSEDD